MRLRGGRKVSRASKINSFQRNFFNAVFFIIVVPVVIVIVKYAEYSESLFVGKDGVGFSSEYGESNYSQLLEFLYFPAKSLVDLLVNRLRVGGLAIELSVDRVSIGMQHFFMFLGFLAWRARKAKP